jgi:hypothetical protein
MCQPCGVEKPLVFAAHPLPTARIPGGMTPICAAHKFWTKCQQNRRAMCANIYLARAQPFEKRAKKVVSRMARLLPKGS